MEWGKFATQWGLESEVNGCVNCPWFLTPSVPLCAFPEFSPCSLDNEAVTSGTF